MATRSVGTSHGITFDAYLKQVDSMHTQGKASFEAEFNVSVSQIEIHTYSWANYHLY